MPRAARGSMGTSISPACLLQPFRASAPCGVHVRCAPVVPRGSARNSLGWPRGLLGARRAPTSGPAWDRGGPNSPPTKQPAGFAGLGLKMTEREKGFEPSTLALARRCSTTELFPLNDSRDEYQSISRGSSGGWIQGHPPSHHTGGDPLPSPRRASVCRKPRKYTPALQ